MQTNNRGDEVMTTLVCRKKVCITDQIQTTFSQKQTRYKQLIPKLQTKILNVIVKSLKSIKWDTVLNTLFKGLH